MTLFDLRPGSDLERSPDDDAWLAPSHATVLTVLRSPDWTSDARTAIDAGAMMAGRPIPEEASELLSKILLFMDGPDHVRLRRLVSKAFTPRSVEQLRPRMVALTEDLLAPLREAGQFDVIDDLAFPLPVTVICELLGIPAQDRDLFRQQTGALAVLLDRAVTDEQLGQAAGAALLFAAYLVPLFEERRRAPQVDLISRLVAAEDEGDQLGADELLITVVLLLAAGHETTMNLIGNGFLALLQHPDQLALLRARPDLMPTAVEELLRYDSPVRLTVRTARVDTILEVRSLQAGDQVIALLHAANHDPTVFESPHRLDITRDARHHVSLGGGAHYCLGANLARAEAQVALTALTALPGLELATEEPVWRPLHALHGLVSLPVTCHPA